MRTCGTPLLETIILIEALLTMSKTSIKIEILTIEKAGIHLMIHAYINRKKAMMILDTGASQTVFDKSRIKRFTGNEKIKENEKRSIGVGGDDIISHETEIKSFRLGKLTIKNYMTVLLDLSHVNKSYKTLGLPAIDGVLGSDILFSHKALIDYNKCRLHLKWKSAGKKKR